MKKYKEYMDEVKAPDALHQKLVGLEPPAQRPAPWRRYGSLAAALLLVCGLGAWGLGRIGMWEQVAHQFQADARMENAEFDGPDIAIEDPSGASDPGEKTLGGYEVTVGSGPEAMVSHYVLPYIEYGDTRAKMELDWGLPNGAVRRDLPQDEIIALMGGEDAVYTHLDWGGYELSGWAAWEQDGTFWGAYICGVEPVYETDSFEFAVTAYQLPPTCVMYPNSVTQEVRGLTITADKYDIELESGPAPERRVSFFKGNCGYRFEVSAYDTEQAELLVSRLVCRIADKGLGMDPEEQFAEMRASTCKTCGEEIVPGTKHFHLLPGADGAGDGEICALPPYDPNGTASADPEAVSGAGIAQPPVLKLTCGDGSLESSSGNYNWSYPMWNGQMNGVIACGIHPLDYREAPSLTTEADMGTFSLAGAPDSVQAVCWPDSEWGNTLASSEEISVERNPRTMECGIALKEGGWIYEVTAAWDDYGAASYVFYIVKS